MNSKHPARPLPEASAKMVHPEFVPVDVDPTKMTGQQRYFIRLVREALVIAYERTPWHQAVALQTRRESVADISNAVALVAGEQDRRRIYVVVGRVEPDKRVMVGTGRTFTEGKEPWGPPPAPKCCECSAPLDAKGDCTRTYSGAPDDLPCYGRPISEAEWRAQYQGDFPPPTKPE